MITSSGLVKVLDFGLAKLARPEARRDRLGGADDERPRRDRAGRPPRHPGLHVARAGRGPRRGRALRRLLLRRRALRDAHREAALRGRERDVAALRDPAGHASAGAEPAPGGGPAAREARRALPREGPRRPLSLGPGAAAGPRGLPRPRAAPRLSASSGDRRGWPVSACSSPRSWPSGPGPGAAAPRSAGRGARPLPEIQRLIDADEITRAFRLAEKARPVLAGDPQFEKLWLDLTQGASTSVRERARGGGGLRQAVLGARRGVAEAREDADREGGPAQGLLALPDREAGLRAGGARLRAGAHLAPAPFRLVPEDKAPPGMVLVPGGRFQYRTPPRSTCPSSGSTATR